MSHPLVKAIGGNQTAVRQQGFAESGLLGNRLGPGVNHFVAGFSVLRPERNYAPTYQRNGTNGASRVLADDGHTLAGCNVVTRTPIVVIPNIEDFGQNLLLPGETIASAHGESIGRMARVAS